MGCIEHFGFTSRCGHFHIVEYATHTNPTSYETPSFFYNKTNTKSCYECGEWPKGHGGSVENLMFYTTKCLCGIPCLCQASPPNTPRTLPEKGVRGITAA